MPRVPKPGGRRAVELGCICPPNQDKYGTWPPNWGGYWIVRACPIHGKQETDEDDE